MLSLWTSRSSRGKQRRIAHGLTLIELLVALAIILVLAAIVLTALYKTYKFAKSFSKQNMSSLPAPPPPSPEPADPDPSPPPPPPPPPQRVQPPPE